MDWENIMNSEDKILTYLDSNQQERNALLNNFLERYFYQNFREGEKPAAYRAVELFIKGNCPNNCAYCYLKRHGKELYPINEQSNEQILKNIKIFLDFYKKQHFKTEFSLFSSDLFKDGFIYDVLDVFYEEFKDKYNPYRPISIMIPDHGNFLYSQEETDKLQGYIDKFFDINLRIIISLSIDGKFMDQNRGDASRTDEFYQRAIEFASKNFYAFHPMVSAINIDKWIDNYDWWHSNEVPAHLADRLMMLEVRDDNWTPKALKDYLNFLNHVIDEEFARTNYDKASFAKRVIGSDKYPGKGYDNVLLIHTLNPVTECDFASTGCSVAKNLCVRAGDLAIVPCHRTSYEQYVIGNYVVENGEIVDVKCKNWEIASAVYSWNRNSFPQCPDCAIRYWCVGPCFGSNFESTGDLFWTPISVCNLFKAKTNFQFMKYEAMGLMPYIEKELNDANAWEKIKKHMEKMKGQFDNCGELLIDKISDTIRHQKNAGDVKLFS